MKAIWKGTIGFGLVSIPVKMYSAIYEQGIKFNQLHATDGGRIRYRKFCERCNQEVPNEEIVKGYEITKGQWVILTEDDFEKLPLKTTKSVEIAQFFNPSELSPLYYSKFYYLVPDKGGEKAYFLLKEAMKVSNVMAIGKVGMRNKEHLVVLKSLDGGIALASLYYFDEVRSPSLIPEWGQEVELLEGEMELALKLVKTMTKELKLEEFRDNYRGAVIKLIEAKLTGKEIKVEEEVKAAKSLMDSLKASLEVASNSVI